MGMIFEPYFKLLFIDLSTTDAVAAGADDTVQLKPDAGFIYLVVEAEVNIPDPAGSAAGTHTLTINSEPFQSQNHMAILVANTGSSIQWGASGFSADAGEQPTGIVSQCDLKAERMYASNDYPINFRYDNDTDVQQAGDRRIEVLVKVLKEAV